MKKSVFFKQPIVIIGVFCLFLGSLYAQIPLTIATTPNIQLALITKSGSPQYQTAFDLDPRTSYELFVESNITLYSTKTYTATFIIDFEMLTAAIAEVILQRVNAGMGLFLQTNNPNQPYNLDAYNILEPILPINITITKQESIGFSPEVYHTAFENINTRELEEEHFLSQRISFLSFPQLLNLSQTVLKPNATQILRSDKNWPIFTSWQIVTTRVVALSAPIRVGSNKNLANWPMFNYWMFALAFELSGSQNYENFGEWQGSPVPQSEAQIIISIILAIITIITIGGFILMKKRSQRIPLQILPPSINIESEQPTPMIENDIKKTNFNEQDIIRIKGEIATSFQELAEGKREKTWNDIGFHKPLAGFLLMFFLALNLLLPLVLIVMYILPTFILQDPAQFGIMFITGNIFSAVFIAGDFGLAQAFDKFVGEQYLKNPKEAVKYIQFFVWFQMLSGIIQTVIIALLGLFVIPKSLSTAFMSYQFLLKAFVQWPGIGYLWTHTLKAIQRTDKEQLVSLLVLIFFDIAGIAIFSAYFLQLGTSEPRIGTVVGAAMGIAVSEVVKTFGLLLISGIVLSHVDKRFSIWDCFRVDFDRALVIRTIVFGFKSMLANVIYLLGNFVVTLVIMLQMPNYTYWGAFLGSATLLLYPVQFMTILFENMLPTNAEAYGAKCYRVSEQYITYGFKYYGIFGIFLFILFAFFVNTFLTTLLPPLFKPMGYFIGFYAITKTFMSLGDYSRLFLISIDRVGLYIVFVTIEQVFRIILFIGLVNNIARPELLLIWGELPGVILKVLLTWIYTNKKVIKVRINWWQTIVAPTGAVIAFLIIGSLFNGIYLKLITLFSGQALVPTIIFAFLICNILALTIYPFMLGFLGGWDDASMKDFHFGVKNAGPSRLFGKLFYTMTVLGTKKSPLHNRFPIQIEGIEDEYLHLYELKHFGE